MPSLDPQFLAFGLIWYLAFLVSITAHEAAHAWAGWKLGDVTAYRGGQVTLNPWPHVRREPFGTVVVPILSYLFAGWVMGWASAPYDPHWAARYPKRAAWMAAAGPAANFVLALLAVLLMRLGIALGWFSLDVTGLASVVASSAGGTGETAAALLSILFSLNLLLGVFNLVPFPPLDGHAVLPLVLPDRLADAWLDWMRQPIFSLVGLVVAWRLIGEAFLPIWVTTVRFFFLWSV